MAVELLETLAEGRIGHIGPVLVSVWYAPLTLRGLDTMARRHRELSAHYGPKVTMVSIVQRLGSPPSPELRERVAVELEALKKQSIGDFVVLRAKGLGAIIARSFLATVALLRGGGLVPMRVLKTAFEAGEEARRLPGQLPEIANDLLLGEALEAFAALPPP